MNPSEERIRANGLEHHLLRWDGGGELVVLMHGFLDLAWSWRAVAEQLAEAGRHVVAFDFRGHGETEWIGAGGYYHFWDYLLDVDELIGKLATEERSVHLVGHSMGGVVALLYAATRPEPLKSLTIVEGLGPPKPSTLGPVERSKGWLDAVRRVRGHTMRPIPTLEEVVRRMRVQNPEIDDDLGLFLAEKATRRVDGGFLFRFDPLHRTPSPRALNRDEAEAFLDAISTPTLVVSGAEGYQVVDKAERLERLRPRQIVEIPYVGHMVHWFQPEALARAIEAHLETVCAEDP